MRTPLRPLARILQARQKGLNPDTIEKENLKLRHEAMREKARGRAQFRLVILCASFVMVFGAIGARMGLLAATEPMEPTSPTATAGSWPPTSRPMRFMPIRR
jgi:cell division protein FtsI (penicillin-binding protein 3)